MGGNAGGAIGGADGNRYAIGAAPSALALADVNGDGRPEIVVGHANGVTALVNQGAGRFGAGASYATSAAVAALAVGDFNGVGPAPQRAATPATRWLFEPVGFREAFASAFLIVLRATEADMTIVDISAGPAQQTSQSFNRGVRTP